MKKSFINYPNCHSGSCQDEFVARLLEFKQNGTYVDIGSAHSMYHNNSHFFDTQLNWSGICIEMDSKWNETYSDRKNCTYLNDDATKIDYQQVFTNKGFKQTIDYLSLDVDVLDLEVAKILLKTSFKFKIIGIEHDHYQLGPTHRDAQRECLLAAGYSLICSDIFVRNGNFENCSYEDWYVDPVYFDVEILEKIQSSSCYPEDIINKFFLGDHGRSIAWEAFNKQQSISG
jgi:hypothetical protein